MPEIQPSFLLPFSNATLRRRGTQFWGSIFAVFLAPVRRQPPPASPCSKPLDTKAAFAKAAFGQTALTPAWGAAKRV